MFFLHVLNGLIFVTQPRTVNSRGAAAVVAWVDHDIYLFGGCFVFLPFAIAIAILPHCQDNWQPVCALSLRVLCPRKKAARQPDQIPIPTKKPNNRCFILALRNVFPNMIYGSAAFALESVLESSRKRRLSLDLQNEREGQPHHCFHWPAARAASWSSRGPSTRTGPRRSYTNPNDPIFPALCRFYGVLWFRITISYHKRHTAAYFWVVNCLHSIKAKAP